MLDKELSSIRSKKLIYGYCGSFLRAVLKSTKEMHEGWFICGHVDSSFRNSG